MDLDNMILLGGMYCVIGLWLYYVAAIGMDLNAEEEETGPVPLGLHLATSLVTVIFWPFLVALMLAPAKTEDN